MQSLRLKSTVWCVWLYAVMWLRDGVAAQANNVMQASAMFSIPYGPGLARATISQPAYFYIQAANQWGANLTTGGYTWKVQMKGPNGVNSPKATLTDYYNGTLMVTYTVAYTNPPITGIYTVEVTLDVNGVKTALRGSPFSVVVVEAAPVDPVRCTPRGVPTSSEVGKISSFSVLARDSNGNLLTQGSEEFVVTLSQGGIPYGSATISYVADGEYNVEFVTTRSDQPLQINIRTGADGQGLAHIQGSPMTVSVQSGMLFPANSDAKGPGIVGGIAGERTTFLVVEQDAWNNDRYTTTESAIPSAYFSGDNTKISLTPNKNGTWTGSYVFPPGQKTLHVKLDGIEISGSPFVVRSTSSLPFHDGTLGAFEGGFLGLLVACGAIALYLHKQKQQKLQELVEEDVDTDILADIPVITSGRNNYPAPVRYESGVESGMSDSD